MLAQATPSPKATVEAARAVANIDPIWGTVITASATIVAALLGGFLAGIIGALTWVSNIYQRRADDLEKLHNSNVSRLEKTLDSEKRSLELTLQHKEAEVRHLRERIKRLENLFTLHFPEINQGNSILQNLQLFLMYVRDQVKDNEKLCQEVDKMTDYLEGQLGLVDELHFRLEAANWITSQIEAESSQKSLIRELRSHVLNEYLHVPKKLDENKRFRDELDRVIENYLKALRFILRASCEPDLDE